MVRRPDLLDCVLSWVISNYELGDYRILDPEQIEQLTSRWLDEFQLDADEVRALHDHHVLDLEWVEMVVPGFWQLLCGDDNQDWGSEALNHIAQLVARRVGDIGRYGPIWGEGTTLARTADGDLLPLVGILSAGFPNPGLV